MSSAVQPNPQPIHPASSYSPTVSNRQFAPNSPPSREGYPTSPAHNAQSSRSERHTRNQPSSPTSQPFSSPLTSTYASDVSPYQPSNHRPSPSDQFDGPPIPPPRSSSQRPSNPNSPVSSPPTRVTPRGARPGPADGRQYDGRIPGQDGRSSGTPQSRRTGPASPQSSGANEYSNQRRENGALAIQGEPNSEVINRVVISDPVEDIQREEERMAEAVPAPGSGLAVVGPEGVDDATARRRQDYSRLPSRRREVQFGEYMLGQTLGEGEFGKVKLGWKKDGSVQVAIKLIRRDSMASNPSRLPKIHREIAILEQLSHPNIVRLHEMAETDRYIGIILEYASGGELFDYILNHRYLKDPAARRLFAQLVSGVGYLHKKGIVHRDLKLENLLLDRNRNIIITDFGFANTFDPSDELSEDVTYNLGNKDFVKKYRLDRQDDRGMRKGDLMQTSCGSPCYAAPELVVSDSLYTGCKVDVWSCGVILVCNISL